MSQTQELQGFVDELTNIIQEIVQKNGVTLPIRSKNQKSSSSPSETGSSSSTSQNGTNGIQKFKDGTAEPGAVILENFLYTELPGDQDSADKLYDSKKGNVEKIYLTTQSDD